tara:strand:+ start:448 stop:1338 length:891 start_codon:yes stop_codon:yes gene_type:complete
MGIVVELQKACLDSGIPVATILRRAKVIASKLGLSDLNAWIDAELSGYKCSMKELPEHRKGVGQPKYFNPYKGWQPIHTGDDWFSEIVRTVFLPQSISEIEHLVASGDSQMLQMGYNPSIAEQIQQCLPARWEVALHFSKVEAVAALDFVRNRTLDWALQLEERGVVGEGLTFEAADKKEAAVVTNNIYGGTVGVLGAVQGNAANSGLITVNGPIDTEALAKLHSQIAASVSGLPEETARALAQYLSEVREQANSGSPSRSAVSSALSSIKSVLEGATGNLTAEGMLAAIAAFAGG